MIQYELTNKQFNILTIRYILSPDTISISYDEFLKRTYNVSKKSGTRILYFNSDKDLTLFLLSI